MVGGILQGSDRAATILLSDIYLAKLEDIEAIGAGGSGCVMHARTAVLKERHYGLHRGCVAHVACLSMFRNTQWSQQGSCSIVATCSTAESGKRYLIA